MIAYPRTVELWSYYSWRIRLAIIIIVSSIFFKFMSLMKYDRLMCMKMHECLLDSFTELQPFVIVAESQLATWHIIASIFLKALPKGSKAACRSEHRKEYFYLGILVHLLQSRDLLCFWPNGLDRGLTTFCV